MTSVRKFYPDVRLTKIAAEAGGMRASEAIARAQDRLQDIQANCLAAVDGKIDKIAELAAGPDDENFDHCYRLANEIFAEAGAFGLNELSAAALNLCNALSAPGGRRVPAKVLRVHADSMRALRAPIAAGDRDLRTAVLSELRRLTAKLD